MRYEVHMFHVSAVFDIVKDKESKLPLSYNILKNKGVKYLIVHDL